MPVEIGRQYMTTWGCVADIMGYVIGRYGQPDPSRVWSAQGDHYHTSTGERVYGGHALVMMDEPEQERSYWVNRLAEIEGANSSDVLALGAPNLERMRARIVELDTEMEEEVAHG